MEEEIVFDRIELTGTGKEVLDVESACVSGASLVGFCISRSHVDGFGPVPGTTYVKMGR
jgi:hypothetical protein